jgi:hypothetical protein
MEINCPKCNEKMRKARTTSLGGKLSLVKEPIKYFTTKESSPLNPYVCSKCGYVEWYVEFPQNFI